MSRPDDPAQPGFDARRFKAMERAGFNRIAARYADGAHLRAELAEALLEAAALTPGQRVLDLASGPGLLAGQAALRVAPGGSVLATDIAEGMLAEGARRCGEHADTPCFAAAGRRSCPPRSFPDPASFAGGRGAGERLLRGEVTPA